MKVIGITGYKKSGKTTVAEQLRLLALPACSYHINFADAVKNEVCVAFRISREYLEAHKDNYRLILQGVGTDVGRKLRGETYWIQKWLETLNKLPLPLPELIVCSDLRFLNEAEAIRQLGGKIIRVYRQGTGSDGHASETELDRIECDYELVNNGSLDDLRNKLKQIKL
jgi:hypothetical protein